MCLHPNEDPPCYFGINRRSLVEIRNSALKDAPRCDKVFEKCWTKNLKVGIYSYNSWETVISCNRGVATILITLCIQIVQWSMGRWFVTPKNTYMKNYWVMQKGSPLSLDNYFIQLDRVLDTLPLDIMNSFYYHYDI